MHSCYNGRNVQGNDIFQRQDCTRGKGLCGSRTSQIKEKLQNSNNTILKTYEDNLTMSRSASFGYLENCRQYGLVKQTLTNIPEVFYYKILIVYLYTTNKYLYIILIKTKNKHKYIVSINTKNKRKRDYNIKHYINHIHIKYETNNIQKYTKSHIQLS